MVEEKSQTGGMLAMYRTRVYVDTSVFGGVHDEEFEEASSAFFRHVAKGRYLVLVSQITLDELAGAPAEVQRVYEGIPADSLEEVSVEEEAHELARTYIEHGALSGRWLGDALHVALATLSRADLILSWNFRHIVNYDKIRKFNSVNLFRGYPQLEIHSPLELEYDDQD